MSQSSLPLPGWGLGAGRPLRPGLLRLRSGWATAELVELSPDSQLPFGRAPGSVPAAPSVSPGRPLSNEGPERALSGAAGMSRLGAASLGDKL